MAQLPVIHSNGTDGAQLAHEYGAALDALVTAIAMMRAITVHGRDYYVINSIAASVAMNEHLLRIRKLEGVERDLNLIYSSIFEQLTERAERAIQ